MGSVRTPGGVRHRGNWRRPQGGLRDTLVALPRPPSRERIRHATATPSPRPRRLAGRDRCGRLRPWPAADSRAARSAAPAADLPAACSAAAAWSGCPGGADRRRGPAVPRRVLPDADRVDSARDAQRRRGRGDLSQHDQGRLHPRRQLRPRRAPRPQGRPHLVGAGDGDDGWRQPRLPGGRAGGRHRARVRDAEEPAGHPQRPEGDAGCRRLGRSRARGPAGERGHRRPPGRGDLLLRPQPRPVRRCVARRSRPLDRSQRRRAPLWPVRGDARRRLQRQPDRHPSRSAATHRRPQRPHAAAAGGGGRAGSRAGTADPAVPGARERAAAQPVGPAAPVDRATSRRPAGGPIADGRCAAAGARAVAALRRARRCPGPPGAAGSSR